MLAQLGIVCGSAKQNVDVHKGPHHDQVPGLDLDDEIVDFEQML